MTIGRPPQFDKNIALEQAMLQFWQHGYESTSVQDLMDCTGLSKSSLYNSFGSKSTLFTSCLTRFKHNLVTNFELHLSNTESGLQFIRDLLNMIISEADKAQRNGCLLVNAANELAGRAPMIASTVEQGFTEVRNFLARALTKAKQTNEIPSDTDVELTADFILSGVIGLRTMVKSGASRHRLQNVSDMLINTLK
jgi:TetR/AcrR family transcriptional repressor of nem operon